MLIWRTFGAFCCVQNVGDFVFYFKWGGLIIAMRSRITQAIAVMKTTASALTKTMGVTTNPPATQHSHSTNPPPSITVTAQSQHQFSATQHSHSTNPPPHSTVTAQSKHSHSTVTAPIPPSHTRARTPHNTAPPPLSTATLHRHSPPPLSTVTLHRHSPPPLSTATAAAVESLFIDSSLAPPPLAPPAHAIRDLDQP